LVHAHAYLQHGAALKNLNSARGVLIVDEAPIPHFLRVETIPMDAVRALATSDKKVPTSAGMVPLSSIAIHLLQGELPARFLTDQELLDGEPLYGAMLASRYRTETWQEGDLDQRVRQSVMDLRDANGFFGLKDLKVNEDATKLLNLLKNARATHAEKYEDRAGKEWLLLRYYADFDALPEVVHILDASLSPYEKMLLEELTGRDVTYHEIKCHEANTKIIHDPSSTMSRSSLKRQLERHDDPAYEGFDRYERVRAMLAHIIHRDGKDQVGVVGHKDSEYIQRLFEDVGLDNKKHYMWFGNLRGLNDFETRKNLVVIGDPSPNEAAFAIEGFRHVGEVSNHVAQIAPYTVDNSLGGSVYTLTYKSLQAANAKLSEHVYQRVVRDEVYQAIGRARGLHGNKNIYLLSHVYPGDELTSAHTYEVNSRLVGQGEGVTDPAAWQRAEALVNLGSTSLRKIEEETGINRRSLSKMVSKGAVRNHESEIVKQMRNEGVSFKEIANSLGIGVRKAKSLSAK